MSPIRRRLRESEDRLPKTNVVPCDQGLLRIADDRNSVSSSFEQRNHSCTSLFDPSDLDSEIRVIEHGINSGSRESRHLDRRAALSPRRRPPSSQSVLKTDTWSVSSESSPRPKQRTSPCSDPHNSISLIIGEPASSRDCELSPIISSNESKSTSQKKKKSKGRMSRFQLEHVKKQLNQSMRSVLRKKQSSKDGSMTVPLMDEGNCSETRNVDNTPKLPIQTTRQQEKQNLNTTIISPTKTQCHNKNPWDETIHDSSDHIAKTPT
eukprot:scaffold38275_cov44-Attheya_sp.AAC.1